ncbi:hypothetical protein QE152_g11002 [Popillia japonica]|uniref:Uncharacterized protein n=1 Tax=Popillia japonica TaxID=7064 RepID=A0AAW1LUN6_POPJA
MPCGKTKGLCPADVEGRLNEYSETTQHLEKQLTEMEEEVRTMQNELIAVRQERMHLEQHRRMMTCPNICTTPCPNAFPPPCPGAPPCPAHPCSPPPCQRPPPCQNFCPAPCNMNKGPSIEQQFRELREKYNYLQEDYKGKLTEVAGLRAEVDRLKQNAIDAENYLQEDYKGKLTEVAGLRAEVDRLKQNAIDAEQAKKIAEDKNKECARLLKECKDARKAAGLGKEQTTELEQQLAVAKQRYREVKDELEEVRALVEEHKAQMEEYRNKYMQAQQTVEEQRRQIDMMELENARIGEQVNLEIQRVKNQFQEKLQELTPLPDILKATQKKLQEVQQMHLLAERKNELLLKDLQTCRDKAGELELEMERIKGNEREGLGEVGQLRLRLEESAAKLAESLEDNERLKNELLALQEHLDETERALSEKAHEAAQLSAEVENVREESARQIARTKERCETIRRSMQLQITELERQLASCRALTRSAQKDRDEIRQKMQAQINNLNENFEDAQMRIRNLQGDRDEIRQKMQAQINNLNENFEDAQMRIRNLQGHVNFLKHSYTNVVPPADVCNCAANPAEAMGPGGPGVGDTAAGRCV